MKKRKQIVVVIISIICLVIVFWGEIFNKSDSFSYAQKIKEAEKLMEAEEIEEAVTALTDIEKEYGVSDRVSTDMALVLMYEREFDKAIEYAEKLTDKKSQEYYSLLENIYEYMGEDGKEMLYDLYIEAANSWPDWQHMQKFAGLVQIERYNYSAAEAYLHQAYELDSTDSMVMYELGVLKYYQGNHEASVHFFEEAVNNNLPIEMYQYVKYYLEQIKEENAI